MKKSTLALSALTLALAAGLSACGGGTSTYTIGGSVVGLEYPGLILSNIGEELPIAAAGYETLPGATAPTPKTISYSFRNELDYGDPYDVVIKQQPQHQFCGPAQNSRTSDTAGRLSVIDATFVCVLASHTIGGTVSGLTSEGLELTNGSTGGILAVPANATKFVFEANPVTYNQTYGVTVLKQPAGLLCSVTNGTGTMGDAAVDTIIVACRSAT